MVLKHELHMDNCNKISIMNNLFFIFLNISANHSLLKPILCIFWRGVRYLCTIIHIVKEKVSCTTILHNTKHMG